MIIDKGVSVGDVVTIKLTSGEELLASLVEETDKYIKLHVQNAHVSIPPRLSFEPMAFFRPPTELQ